jgi:hypothetical protein
MNKKTLNEFLIGLSIAVLVIALLMFSGCGTAWKQAKCRQWNCCPVVADSSSTVIRDSIFIIRTQYVQPKDSATARMLLKCDSAGRIYLDQAEYWQGKYVVIKTYLDNNTLTSVAVKPEITDSVDAMGKVHTRLEYRDRVVQVNVPAALNGWERFRIAAFPYMGAFILIVLAYIAMKLYRKFR